MSYHALETMNTNLTIHPLTPDRWRDLEALFQTNAVTRDCWCMWFRTTNAEFNAGRKEPNRRAFKRIVDRAEVPPGLLAYLDGEPAGWCALAPRDDYPRIQRARAMKPIDDKPAWAITCFFVRRTARTSSRATRSIRRSAASPRTPPTTGRSRSSSTPASPRSPAATSAAPSSASACGEGARFQVPGFRDLGCARRCGGSTVSGETTLAPDPRNVEPPR